jgi:anti-sigma regulatory factor (Ser/Thr protein kinase)
MSRNLVEVSVRCDELAPARVRATISALEGVDGVALEDAKIVASELVTNAVLHSQCSEEESLSVRVSGNGGLRISVLDPGRSGGAAEIADRRPELGGMGLKVVSQLARGWGSERRPEGFEVWADLEAEQCATGETAQTA